MTNLTQSPTEADLASLIVEAHAAQARNHYLETAEDMGLSLAYRLPPKFGQSGMWLMAFGETAESGLAILFGDDGQRAELTWAQFRLMATPAY